MPRRPAIRDFACLPALLAAMGASWALAGEPFPFPAPPVRSQPVYLAPDSLPALPTSGSKPAGAPSSRLRLQSAAGIMKTQAVEEEAVPPRQGGLVPPVRKSIVADTAESERRVERLKRQLDELNDMLSRPPVEPPVIERSIVPPYSPPTPPDEDSPFAPNPLPQPPAAPTHAASPVAPEATSAPVPAPESAPSHHGPAHVADTPSSPPAETARSTSSSLIKGLPVSAIDRVYVADNLFAAGEYVLANDIYLQVDRRAVSGDESGWVEFQLANCSRRLGRIDDARKRYRRVVADPTLGWLQDLAKWRLDAIDERDLLVKEHARLDAVIKQHTEVPRAPAKK